MTEMLHTAQVSTYLPTYTVPGYQQAYAEQVLYYDGFETGTTGWSAVQAVASITRTSPGHAGAWALTANRNTGTITTSSVMTKTFTSLTVGRSHTVSVWHRANDGVVGDVYTTLRVAGVGDDGGQYHTGGDFTWYRHAYTFTPTSTSITVRLEWASAYTGADVLWDEVTVSRDAYAADIPAQTITTDGATLTANPKEITATLDESWSPFAQARVTVANQNLSAMEAIDPHTNPRMRLDMSARRRESKTMDDFNAYMKGKYGASPTMANFNTEYITYSMTEFNNGRYGSPTPPAWSRSYSLGEVVLDEHFVDPVINGWTAVGTGTYSATWEPDPTYGDGLMALTGTSTQVAAFRYVDGFEVGATYRIYVWLSSKESGVTTRHSQIYLQTPGSGPIWATMPDIAPGLQTRPNWSRLGRDFVALDTRAGLMVQMYTTGVVGTTYVDDIQIFRISSPADPDPISMDLGIRSREIDYNTGEVTFTLASDEAILQDTPLISTTPRTPAVNTVYDCVNLALQTVGAAIPAATTIVQPAVTRYSEGWEGSGTAGWASENAATISNSTAQFHSGTRSMGITFTQASTVPFGGPVRYATFPVTLETGRTHTFKIWVRNTLATSRVFYLSYSDDIGGTAFANSGSITSAAGWVQISLTVPAVSIVANGLVGVQIQLPSGTGATGETFYVDDFLVTRDAYTYSPSTVSVPADAAVWKPGVTAWDYLTPILGASNLRLWCDEKRQWHLAPPQTYSTGATVLSDVDNIQALAYEVDREDDTWFDAAIVIYNWTDVSNIPHTSYDTYATPGWTKGRTFTYDDTVYPGPGAALNLVQRASTRGKSYPITAVSNYGAYPGDVLTLKQKNKPDTTGNIESVAWTFPDHEMRIEPRGMSN